MAKYEFEFEANFDFESTDKKVKRLQEESQKIVKDDKTFRRYLNKSYNKVEAIAELCGRYPAKREQIRIITQKSFNAFAILLYIVERHNIDECYLTTYNIDKSTIKGLEMLAQSGNIKKLTILVSQSIEFRIKDRANELKEMVKRNKNINLILAWNHTKILACKVGNDFYVVEGSGNLSDNARIEQYLFENCKETYEFHKKWIEDTKKENFKNTKVFK